MIRAELAGDDIATALGIAAKSSTPVIRLCAMLIEGGHDPAAKLAGMSTNSGYAAISPGCFACGRRFSPQHNRHCRQDGWASRPMTDSSRQMRRRSENEPI